MNTAEVQAIAAAVSNAVVAAVTATLQEQATATTKPKATPKAAKPKATPKAKKAAPRVAQTALKRAQDAGIKSANISIQGTWAWLYADKSAADKLHAVTLPKGWTWSTRRQSWYRKDVVKAD